MRADAGGQALSAALEKHRALGHLELSDVSREPCDRGEAQRARKDKSTDVDQTN
jgi:hypothetical protein